MVKAYRRKHNHRLIKSGMSYTTQDIVELLKVYKTTVRNWCKSGLPNFRHGNKIFVYSDDLIQFIKDKNVKGKYPCKENELPCLKCRGAKIPVGNMVDAVYWSETRFKLKGFCPDCGGIMNKEGSPKKLELYRSLFSLQTIQDKRLDKGLDSNVSCNIKEGV